MSDIISRLDYTNQLKPSDDSVVKCNENIPKIDYVFKNKTNPTISEHQQSLPVQDTISESALLPPKWLSQPHDTGANFCSVDSSLKEDLLPVIAPCSKKINIGAPGFSPDVPEVHSESKDYILQINFEAVLEESLYSDTVYTAECITSEGILTDNFSESDNSGWTTAYKFIYADGTTERSSENNIFGK